MELKRYQTSLLEQTQRFLEALAAEQQKGNRHASLDAWKTATGRALRAERHNGLDEDLPNFCIKVPTGGGKTLIATQILGQIHSNLLRDRGGSGLVLWIVPSDQIYKDTLKHLRDRAHPYRERLEFAVGNRIEVWEKDEIARLTPGQLATTLNVLLLKLASANRETRDQLKMFQDSGGNIVQHFPAEDDAQAQRALKARVKNLDMLADDLVKTSLANLLRMQRPAVVLDEGHKAYSKLARETLEGFNAAIIVELSATPTEQSNVLVRVSGKELLDEEMIKLPLNIAIAGEANWKTCLGKAKDKREELASKAAQIARDGAAIRPMVLVQVERTGEKQRDAGFVHAEDVKQHLIEKLGVSEAEIAIKSSEKDDIEGIPLLDEGCLITWIITKSALQEGWDCPFAYILVSLNNSQSKLSMTQLVGRVLRQPYARKTRVPELDESYVYCVRKSASEVMREVKAALESEGYEGEAASVVDRSSEAALPTKRVARIRPEFKRYYRDFKGKVYLPRFCVKLNGAYEALDYFQHLVRTVEIERFDFASIDWELQDELKRAREGFYRIALDQQDIEIVRQQDALVLEDDQRTAAWLIANLAIEHFSHRELRQIVDAALAQLLARDATLGGRLALVKFGIRDRLAKFVEAETDKQTHRAFVELHRADKLCFFLECIECRFDIPPEIELRSLRQLTREDGTQVQRSLFDAVPEDALNEQEKAVALWLDRDESVLWWYRNEVGPQHFAIQGYRRPKIYPDFVVQKGTRKQPDPTVLVVESKGAHLAGNPDTEYKRDVAKSFTTIGKAVSWQKLGAGFENSTFRFQVIDTGMGESWKDGLRELLYG